MDASGVERYLHDHIPLSAAMGARVVRAEPDGVVLQAPLEPNLNHRDTAFGGSVAAMAILAGWTLVHLRLRADGVDARTVIQRSDVAYLHPVEEAFQAAAEAPGPGAWARFHRTLERWGRARIHVETAVICGGREVARLRGEYVTLRG